MRPFVSRTVHLLSHLILPTIQPGLLLMLLIRKLRLNAQSWKVHAPDPRLSCTISPHPHFKGSYAKIIALRGQTVTHALCRLILHRWPFPELGFLFAPGGIHVFKDQRGQCGLSICSYQAGAHPVSFPLVCCCSKAAC